VSGALAAARNALGDEAAWVVGGALRDRLLGRETDDVDLVVAGDVAAAARQLGAVAGATPFHLSERFGAWRVVSADRKWQIDLAPLRGPTIEEDLALRDFTVNALAEPLAGGRLIDPLGGARDLLAGRLRAASASAFADDPLRALRVARFACQLGLEPDTATIEAARASATAIGGVAGERVFAELRQILCADEVLAGLELIADLGLTPVVLPELHALRGVEQSRYHHLDVYDHTLAALAALIELERAPAAHFGEHAAAVAAVLDEPLADELTRGQALRLGILLHDTGKPRTRGLSDEGKITFYEHDRVGAELARTALARLRTSERLTAYVAALTRHHLRLGFLVRERPLTRRAIYRYLATCAPVAIEVSVLSVADRLATRGRKAEEAIARHSELARELLGEALAWRAAGPPTPLIRGDDLAAELAIEAGPELGRLLAELEEARFAGEVSTREQAIGHARALLGH